MDPALKNVDDQISKPTEDDSISRRELARKAAYIAPAVLAVISATDRPAIAQSAPSNPPPD